MDTKKLAEQFRKLREAGVSAESLPTQPPSREPAPPPIGRAGVTDAEKTAKYIAFLEAECARYRSFLRRMLLKGSPAPSLKAEARALLEVPDAKPE